MHFTCRGETRDTYSPEVVDQNVEDAENDNQEGSAELGLESNDNHDAGDKTEERDNDAPDGPLSAEDEADEEEDEQNSTSKLEVHLAVLFLNLRQAGESLGLAHPRIREHHEKSTHDRQVAEEEVEIEDETISKCLGDDDTNQASNCVFRVFSDNDEGRARSHGDNVDDEEEVRDTRWDCQSRVC